jgi:predicted HicB family RNase H-like nuclease
MASLKEAAVPINVRVPASLHAVLAREAAATGLSLSDIARLRMITGSIAKGVSPVQPNVGEIR